MIAFLVLVLVAGLFFFCFYRFNGFLSPSAQLSGMFLIGMFSYVANASMWQAELSVTTAAVIMASLVLFAVGEMIALNTSSSLEKRLAAVGNNVFNLEHLKSKHNKTYTVMTNNAFSLEHLKSKNNNIYIAKRVFIIFTVISCLSLVMHFGYILKMYLATGRSMNVARLINWIYVMQYDPTVKFDLPFYIAFGEVITSCFSYFCMFIIVVDCVKREKMRILYTVPIICSLLHGSLWGGRTYLLRFVVSLLFMYIFVRIKVKNDSPKSLKLIIIILLGMVLFVVGYKVYGTIRGMGNGERINIKYFFQYPGKPIQALNVYFAHPTHAQIFGEETLVTVRHIMRKLGFDVIVPPLPLEYANWSNSATNLYTAIRRYYFDYGVFAFIIIAVEGLFYGFLEKKLLTGNKVFPLFVYCYFSYPVIEFLFEERFFIGVFSATTVYWLVIMLLMQPVLRCKVIEENEKK